MLPNEFFYYVYAEKLYYFGIWFSVAIIYYIVIYKRYITSIIDPLFIAFFFSIFGTTDVIFLFANELIRENYFLSFVATQVAFIFGFVLYKPIYIQKINTISQQYVMVPKGFPLKTLLYISLILLLVTQIYFYILHGIPMFMESRISFLYTNSVLTKILNKFLPVVQIIVCYIALYNIIFVKKISKVIVLVSYFALLFIFITLILTGARSTILLILLVAYSFYLYMYRYSSEYHIKIVYKFAIKIFIVAVILLFIISILKYGGLNFIIYRLIHTGDTFFYAYPNDVIETLRSSNIFVALFPGFSNIFFGADIENIPSLGIELFQTVTGIERIDGPNARHNVFGLVHLGPYFSVLYSFLLGNLLGISRSWLYYKLPPTVFGGLVYTMVFACILGIETDAGMSFGKLVGMFVVGGGLIFFSFLLNVKTFRVKNFS